MNTLRIWVTRTQAETEKNVLSLRVKDFKPFNSEDNIEAVLGVVNHHIFQGRIKGKIISVETVECDSSDDWEYNSENTFVGFGKLKDDAISRFKVSVLRVFYDAQQDSNEEIGMADFVPQFRQKDSDSRSYEKFSSLVKRASKWLSLNPEITFCGSQSLDTVLRGRVYSIFNSTDQDNFN